MDKLKIAAWSMVGLLAFIALLFVFGFVDLGMLKVFGVRRQNIRREIFEETKSYTHGKIQDLAKYYEEYQTSDDKEAIRQLVLMNFADFDAAKIRPPKLRQFLINMRGY